MPHLEDIIIILWQQTKYHYEGHVKEKQIKKYENDTVMAKAIN